MQIGVIKQISDIFSWYFIKNFGLKKLWNKKKKQPNFSFGCSDCQNRSKCESLKEYEIKKLAYLIEKKW